MAEISVIIPVFNTEQYVYRCLDSVLGQDLEDLEVICVDDVSTDGSAALIQRRARKDSRLRYVRQEVNAGPGQARNRGIDAATGHYVYFLDSDDWIEPDFLSRMWSMAAETGRDVIINSSFVKEYDGTGKKEYGTRFGFLEEEPRAYDTATVLLLFPPVLWARLYRRSYLTDNQIRFPDLRGGGEDNYFTTLAELPLPDLFVFRGPYYHYFQRDGSLAHLQEAGYDFIKSFKALYAELRARSLPVDGIALELPRLTRKERIQASGRKAERRFIDELRSIPYTDSEGNSYHIVMGRSAEMRIVDPKTEITLFSSLLPYGAKLYKAAGDLLQKGDVIAEWDPYNAVIISDVAGKVSFENVIENVTYRVESDAQTGLQDKVVIESRQRTKNPTLNIVDSEGNILKVYDLPVGAHIGVEQGQGLKAGDIMVKIPRSFGKAGDITGGLPRVTELFEARNPSDPAIVAEVDGIVSIAKKLKRGNREITITSKTGEQRSYLIPTSKQILAQDSDYVKAGTPLSDGAITPADILAIKGPMKVQEYIVNEVQEVYRLQGVKINDKHFEVIVRQMMRKVEILDPGDTRFLEGDLVNKLDFNDVNDQIFGMKVVEDAGDSEHLSVGQIVTARELRDENSALRRQDKHLVTARDAHPATCRQVLQGITRASLQTKSFISAASFQETTKVLTEAAINAKRDTLVGMKENVIVGHLIPAGTGMREYQDLIVGNAPAMSAAKED